MKRENTIIQGLEITLVDGEVMIEDEAVLMITDFCKPLIQIEYDPETETGIETISYEASDCMDEDMLDKAGISIGLWSQIAAWIANNVNFVQCAYA